MQESTSRQELLDKKLVVARGSFREHRGVCQEAFGLLRLSIILLWICQLVVKIDIYSLDGAVVDQSISFRVWYV